MNKKAGKVYEEDKMEDAFWYKQGYRYVIWVDSVGVYLRTYKDAKKNYDIDKSKGYNEVVYLEKIKPCGGGIILKYRSRIKEIK